MRLPCIGIVTASALANVNKVWEAMGRGPDNFSAPLCAIAPDVTWETPPTHYLMSDGSSEDTDILKWQQLSEGILPEISGTWGENGVISEEDAIEACSPANLQIYNASGDVDMEEFKIGVITGRNLMEVPWPIFT